MPAAHQPQQRRYRLETGKEVSFLNASKVYSSSMQTCIYPPKHSPKVRWRVEQLHMRLAVFCIHPFISYPFSHQPCLDLPLATHLASATDQDSRWTPPSSQMPCRSNSFPISSPPRSTSSPSPFSVPSPCRPQASLTSDNSELGPSTHWHRLRLDGQFQSTSMQCTHACTHPSMQDMLNIPLHVTHSATLLPPACSTMYEWITVHV